MVNQIFLEVLNTALISGILIVVVCLARLLIKRAPKWFSCVLWAFVAIRLVLPISLTSVFSLMPKERPISGNMVDSSISQMSAERLDVNKELLSLVGGVASTPGDAGNSWMAFVSVASTLWLAGVAILVLYAIFSSLMLKRQVRAARETANNIFVCDEVNGPFILGICRPRIYLPSGMEDLAYECVLEHERTHVKRFDHLWKPLGYLILAIYWFQPLCWLAYILLCKDIELACDEKVTKDRDKEWKVNYCQTLLDCKRKRRMITACPVAFGEVGIKTRVKAVIQYKKPTFWITLSALLVGCIVFVCFMTNPKEDKKPVKQYTLQDRNIDLSSSFRWGDQRDWLCGTITKVSTAGYIGIARNLFVSEKDTELRERLQIPDDYFFDGCAIVAVDSISESVDYPFASECEFVFIDRGQTFKQDERVKQLEDGRVSTTDYFVFLEYLGACDDLSGQIFFYDIKDGAIVTVYEVILGVVLGT